MKFAASQTAMDFFAALALIMYFESKIAYVMQILLKL